MNQATAIRIESQISAASLASDATVTTNEYLNIADTTFCDCRQRLITYLVKLNHALDEDLVDLSQAILSRFCDSLVDYLSAGHFRVFQRVALTAYEYAAIESTTHVAMSFNDVFGDAVDLNVGKVKVALEGLALALGTRFELEDVILLADHRNSIV